MTLLLSHIPLSLPFTNLLPLLYCPTLLLLLLLPTQSIATHCRYLPSDPGWPSPHAWTAFNTSVGGRLVATVPLAAPCHNDRWAAYDKAECAVLRDEWLWPQVQ